MVANANREATTMAANTKSSYGLDDFADQIQETVVHSKIQLASMPEHGTEESNSDKWRRSEVRVNIDDTVNHIMSRLEAYTQGNESYRLICRVPDKFHNVNREAYIPFSWSFGPYHHGDDRLLDMEKHKPVFLMGILGNHTAPLKSYVWEIESMEAEARKYYSEDIKLESKAFTEMLLLDGCCLLNGIIGGDLSGRKDSNPPAVEPNSRPEQIRPRQRLSYRLAVYHDILLLENQIPFFVLQNIYNVANGGSTPTGQLERELIKWLKGLTFPELPGTITGNYQIHHILHLLHHLIRPTLTRREDQSVIDDEKPRRWRRAIEYHEAGVTFKKKDTLQKHSLLDVEFRSGTLWIPFLEINDLTETIFKNLTALEVETAQHGYDVTSYVLFMSDLLSMPEDVTLLSRKDIIIHNLGSDKEVSQLFKGIRKHAPCNMKLEPHMKSLYLQLEKHHGSRWNRWRAWLKHKHFSNPWLILALLAAIIMLFFTTLQGVFAVLSYEQQQWLNRTADKA